MEHPWRDETKSFCRHKAAAADDSCWVNTAIRTINSNHTACVEMGGAMIFASCLCMHEFGFEMPIESFLLYLFHMYSEFTLECQYCVICVVKPLTLAYTLFLCGSSQTMQALVFVQPCLAIFIPSSFNIVTESIFSQSLFHVLLVGSPLPCVALRYPCTVASITCLEKLSLLLLSAS